MAKFLTRFDQVPRPRVLCTEEEKRTKSEFAEECNINTIMARYKKTGVLPDNARAAAARFGDFSQVPTFQEMQHKLIAAHEMFAALPSDVRKMFDNDPGEFIAAADTLEGRQLLVKLGLGAEVPSPDEPVSAPVQGATAGTEPAEPPKAAKKGKSEE